MKRLDGKIVVMTGVASGIGRASANLFAKEGARILGVDIDEEGGNSITENVRVFGGRMTFVKSDVSKVDDIRAVFEIAQEMGGVDILFNNAGVEVAKSLLETTEEDWDKNVGVNLKSVFFYCKHAIEQMKEKGKGVIINTSSVAGLVGSFSPAYSAAKGGIIALTKALATDFGQFNIRVNCILPGAIETPMLERVIKFQGEPSKVRVRRLKNYPLARFGYPDEVAQTALFLAADDSSFISGASIPVDGGFTAK